MRYESRVFLPVGLFFYMMFANWTHAERYEVSFFHEDVECCFEKLVDKFSLLLENVFSNIIKKWYKLFCFLLEKNVFSKPTPRNLLLEINGLYTAPDLSSKNSKNSWETN